MIYRINVSNGAIKWQANIPRVFDKPETLQLRPTDKGLVVWDIRRMVMLSDRNGQVRWGPLYPSKPDTKRLFTYELIERVSIPARSRSLYIYSGQGKIYRYDLNTGKRKWKFLPHKKDGIGLKGPLLEAAGKLYVSTWKSFSILNASTGKRLARFQLPLLEGGLIDDFAPDILIERGNKVIITRPGGAVYALSKKTNRMLLEANS